MERIGLNAVVTRCQKRKKPQDHPCGFLLRSHVSCSLRAFPKRSKLLQGLGCEAADGFVFVFQGVDEGRHRLKEIASERSQHHGSQSPIMHILALLQLQ